MDNEMTLSFIAKSENESLARMAIMSFIAQLDPTVDELSELKTIISEAVSNAIIHGYEEDGKSVVTVRATLTGDTVQVSIQDYGKGISDVAQAMEPLFTTKAALERSGMGFTIMESFADELVVQSVVGEGTSVVFTKKISSAHASVM
ncbi:anti-sigma F factor [Metasolibacillus sp. FSL H7-0170]|uniref:anti-sigma F factor n=1 Tax=Metasolibacillus TaxID=2703677 RepID=UPI000791C8DB|nr:anti-sigma F factor [Metasolibacillus fluoroglycofenilyticus]KYG89073.1 anti-sigma F factor [[Bacillus] sp. KCTC 13219]